MLRETIRFALLVSPLCVFAQQLDRPGEWIDLTHPFNSDSIYWPTSPEFRKSTIAEGHTDGGWYYTAYEFSTAEHGGTHLDAPVHFAEGRHTTDQIPITRLTGPAVVIRVGDRAAGNRDYLISVADIRAWEKKHGRIATGAIVLFDTGSAPLYGDKVAYMGTDRRGKAAVDALHFPGLHPDAARFLADERDIDAVGLDTPSIDYGQSKDFMAHRILFEKNIPAFENLANLDKLPDKGAYVIALPMKIEGGSGGPLRIVAFLNHQTTDKK
ncbi:cyclase family protein [Biformimicrobium ophioploci]|uniref:Cyclase family protein n=1 Tax=Biformimicrobium ophioploci TaxID=3036711 RepID=A0ABQ6M1Z1_9GAMM|nr:cyclase family protein [Microbulbifer sp. NKW57]GMG88343.1 cyclase family protein [Microbulbifer sp. NKW57]